MTVFQFLTFRWDFAVETIDKDVWQLAEDKYLCVCFVHQMLGLAQKIAGILLELTGKSSYLPGED